MDQSKQLYSIGQHVIVQIEKLYPYGIFVRLEDGTRGYIRRRELSWESDTELRHLVHVGQQIEAVVQVLPAADRMLELSVRATLPDPWEKFITTCRVGDAVEATVKRIRSHGIYAVIVPGIHGLVPHSELAIWDVAKAEDIFWIGDRIEAVVTAINGQPRSVTLSIRMRMKQLAKDLRANLSSDKPRADSASLQTELRDPPAAIDTSTDTTDSLQIDSIAPDAQRVGPILVVDDEICIPMVEWLRRHGYAADAARTPADAIEEIHQQRYSLLLVDIELDGMDGLALVRQMQAEGIQTQIAVMSATERLSERIAEIEKLGVIAVFAKPLDLEEIEQFLDRIGNGELIPQWQATATRHQHVDTSLLQEYIAPANNGSSLGEQLNNGLVKLIETTRADEGIVFYLDPTSQAISVRAHAGVSTLVAEAIYSLGDSPVKDVIRDRALVFENHIASQEQLQRRFRKLLDLLHFDSCIGVPIETSSGISHALFLFHCHHDWLHQSHLHDALVTATLFSVLLERQIFDQHILSLGKFLLTGQLAAGFGHEVYNEMSGLEIQLRNLQTDARLLGQRALGQADRVEVQDVQHAIDDLVGTAKKLRGTAELFQGLLHAENDETVNVHDTLQKAAALLRPVRQKANVKLRIIAPAHVPLAIGSSIRLQQVFLNIMLNAIQHMAPKLEGDRLLEVNTEYSEVAGDRRVKVNFRDTGPGIHKRLWDSIFDLGFSTRPNGTGLGLFVARSLVESLGGKIIVLRSIVPIGTTFLVELRATPAQELIQ
jgi:signal transduction histidine kinase/predicted RNA-binding protein with RPS1 domain/ActR/RegA family two-component response regulator